MKWLCPPSVFFTPSPTSLPRIARCPRPSSSSCCLPLPLPLCLSLSLFTVLASPLVSASSPSSFGSLPTHLLSVFPLLLSLSPNSVAYFTTSTNHWPITPPFSNCLRQLPRQCANFVTSRAVWSFRCFLFFGHSHFPSKTNTSL